MENYKEHPTNEPIYLPKIGTEYWFIHLRLSEGRYAIARCKWEGYLSDKARYIANYYTSEQEAWKAADHMNALLDCMVQPMEPSVKERLSKLKLNHPDILP